MSLVSTLGRMAVGVLVAKGVGKMMDGGRSGATPGRQSGGLGGLLGGLTGGGSARAGGGGLGGALGGMLGGAGGGGGLGNLGALLGGRSGGSGGSGGGLSGGLGGLLESIGGGRGGSLGAQPQAPAGGSFGGLLNQSLQGERVPEPSADQEALAKVMIQAMISAAKSDGNVDQDEQQKIVSHLGDDVTEEERQFVLDEMRAPLDLDGLVRSVPPGAEAQVYTMSLMGIDLDTQEEARYLDSLRQKLELSEQVCNDIHQKLGVPTLHS